MVAEKYNWKECNKKKGGGSNILEDYLLGEELQSHQHYHTYW